MKILINDFVQNSGAPDKIKSPSLSDSYDNSNIIDIPFSSVREIDCIGVGNTDAVVIKISNGVDMREVLLNQRAPRHNGLYLIDKIKSIYKKEDEINFVTAPENNGWNSSATSPFTGRIVAVAGSGINRIAYSDDNGATWTAVAAPENNSWASVTCSPLTGRFVAVARIGTNRVIYSDDGGVTWIKLPIIGLFYSITCSPLTGRFVAVAAPSAQTVLFLDFLQEIKLKISHNGTYIGRIGLGKYRKLSTTITKEPGFYSTQENRVTESGDVVAGKGGYSGRRFEANVSYEIDRDVYNDIDNAYANQIAKGYPYFMLLDDEQHKIPESMLHFYARTNEPISLFQSSVYEFLYSYKFSFYESF